MFWDTLAVARDAAVILLALEAILLSLVPLLIFYQTARFMRKLVPRVAPAMRRVHQGLLKVSGIIAGIMGGIRAPFVWASSTRAALSDALGGLRHSRSRGRR